MRDGRILVDDDDIELLERHKPVQRAPLELGMVRKIARLTSIVSGDWWNTASSTMAESDMKTVSARRALIWAVVICPMKALHQL
jgi:hypothetical protein